MSDIDNEQDRFLYGYDAGVIVDGVVQQDPISNEVYLVDEDGKRFVPDQHLKQYIGKQIRLTCISLSAIQDIEKMIVNCEK